MKNVNWVTHKCFTVENLLLDVQNSENSILFISIPFATIHKQTFTRNFKSRDICQIQLKTNLEFELLTLSETRHFTL